MVDKSVVKTVVSLRLGVILVGDRHKSALNLLKLGVKLLHGVVADNGLVEAVDTLNIALRAEYAVVIKTDFRAASAVSYKSDYYAGVGLELC